MLPPDVVSAVLGSKSGGTSFPLFFAQDVDCIVRKIQPVYHTAVPCDGCGYLTTQAVGKLCKYLYCCTVLCNYKRSYVYTLFREGTQNVVGNPFR